MSIGMTLRFLGAAGTVTGSRYLLDAGGRRLLVDCGLFQGYKQLRLRNWSPPPFAVAELEAVVLTHAHIDHSGYVPRMFRLGYRGPVYCSPGTHELCRVMLPDSGYLQEEDARFANAHGFSKHRPALPLYTRADAEACLSLFRSVKPGKGFEPVAGVAGRLKSAGHILGANFVRLEHGGVSVTFSGDIGRPQDVLMRAPELPDRTDYLVIESTYGDRRHPHVDPGQELGRWLRATCDRGGVTLIPTFAVGRAQALLWQIAQLKEHGQLPDVPVFLDSPMAVDVTGIYRDFQREHRLAESAIRSMCSAAAFVNSVEESQGVDARNGPMIVLSAAGMATGGRVLHHLKAFAGDSRNLILFAGFQAPGTRGAALVAGARRIRIHGEEHAVEAQVAELESFSSHADADELLAWMRGLPAAPRRIFVTHGEPGASDTLRGRIEHELGWSATVPEHGELVELS